MGWKRGSYRTIRRFFNTVLPWPVILWEFFQVHCFRREQTYLLIGDETVIGKAGKETHGVGRFFSSLYNQPIAGLSFFCLSVVSIESSKAWPLRVVQLLPRHKKKKAKTEEKTLEAEQKQKQGKPGRPKGSKNKDKTQVELTPELRLIRSEIQAIQATVHGAMSLAHVVLDGHFGHNPATQMVRQCELELISKLRHDSKLFLPYDGSDKRRKYGERIDPKHMPESNLVASETEDNMLTQTYQLQALSPKFPSTLNVVVIVKTHLKNHQRAHVILFSSDLALSAQQIVQFYSLRFQIEFIFRHAKQFFGLEDFMNRNETGVTNASNLAFFMVMVSRQLLLMFKPFCPNATIFDLKAWFRGYRYADQILKLLPQKPDLILSRHIFDQIANLGAIHPFSSPHSSHHNHYF